MPVTWAPYFCSFLMNVGLVVFWVSMPYLVQDWFDAGPAQLGLLGGLSSASYVMTCLQVGRLSRWMTRRQMMALGSSLIALGVLLICFAPSLWVVMVIILLHGAGHGLFWPAIEAHLSAGVGPTELRHRMGWFNLSWSSGDALGAFIGGALYTASRALVNNTSHARLQALPFVLTVGFAVTVGIMALRMLRAAPATRSVRDQDDHHVPRSPGRGGAAFLGVFWVMALIANSSAVAFRGILANVFPNLGKGILGYSAFEWGILYAMIPLSRTVMFYFWQTRRGWEYKARYLIGFQLLLLAGAVVLVFNSSYAVFLITFAVIGVGMSKTYFSSLYYAMDSDHSHESRGGTHEAALGAGSALGAPLAGLLARISGSARAPYVFAFSFLTAAMLVQAGLYVTRRGRARRAASE